MTTMMFSMVGDDIIVYLLLVEVKKLFAVRWQSGGGGQFSRTVPILANLGIVGPMTRARS